MPSELGRIPNEPERHADLVAATTNIRPISPGTDKAIAAERRRYWLALSRRFFTQALNSGKTSWLN